MYIYPKIQITKRIVAHTSVIPVPIFMRINCSGSLSFPIMQGTMNCALPRLLLFPLGTVHRAPCYSLLITGYCILSAITAANLILYTVPLTVLDLLQMVHQLTDRLLFGFWEKQLPLLLKKLRLKA